jgi:DNA-binding NtrC family response regulator
MTDPVLNGARVFVAEDELLVAMLIEDILADSGCQVIGPFARVTDAMAAADAAEVDVALLDVNLRGEAIYPVAERLAARGIPFVLLSGYGRDAVPADRPGWVACPKPFRAEELVRMIAERLAA